MSTAEVALSTRYNLEEQERMSRARNYFAWQGELVRREIGRRVVEVGCGLGNFTGLLLDRELVVAVDADPECVERVNARYAASTNLHTVTCDVSSPDFLKLQSFEADSCVCMNVLEHIEDDQAALGRMAAILKPGGVIVLFVPALAHLYGPADKNLGHYRRYTRRRIEVLAENSGLTLAKMHFVNFFGMFGWWFNAHVLKLEAQSDTQIEIFDRLVVPVISRLEELVPPPLGQSLFAVIHKN